MYHKRESALYCAKSESYYKMHIEQEQHLAEKKAKLKAAQAEEAQMVAAAEKAEQQYAAQEAEKLLTNTPDAVKKNLKF